MITIPRRAGRIGRISTLTLAGLAACFLVSMPGTADAQTTRQLNQCPGQVSGQLAFRTLQLARDTPIGAPISEVQTLTYSFRCERNKRNRGPFRASGQVLLRVSTTVPDVWETGTPGIGIRVTDSYGDRVVSHIGIPASIVIGPSMVRGGSMTTQLSFQLVKTGTISSTQIRRQSMLAFYTYSASSFSIYGVPSAQTALPSTTLPAARSCRVTTRDVGVPLLAAHAYDLGEAGSTTGNTSFLVGLQCDNDANVYMTLTDATTPGNRSDLLTLTSDSTAQGVRLRIRNADDEPVRFGPDSATAGTLNQWRVGQFSGATNIRMSAEYVSTGNVTPGTVRGLATFTMSYQ